VTAPRRRKRRRSQKSFSQAMFGLETLRRSRRRRGQSTKRRFDYIKSMVTKAPYFHNCKYTAICNTRQQLQHTSTHCNTLQHADYLGITELPSNRENPYLRLRFR